MHQETDESIETTNSQTQEGNHTKLWLVLLVICGVALTLSFVKRGTMSGMAVGEGDYSIGCGGGEPGRMARSQKGVQPQLLEKNKGNETNTLQPSHLRKRGAANTKVDSTFPQETLKSRVVPLPKLLTQLKQQRLQQRDEPVHRLKRARLLFNKQKNKVLPLQELLKRLKQQTSSKAKSTRR